MVLVFPLDKWVLMLLGAVLSGDMESRNLGDVKWLAMPGQVRRGRALVATSAASSWIRHFLRSQLHINDSVPGLENVN